MKGGVFKLNMHPRDYFDRNPYQENGKGGKGGKVEKSKNVQNQHQLTKNHLNIVHLANRFV